MLGSVTLICSGGSICNEILTATGWNPAFCVEAIVRDIMTNMTEAIPRPGSTQVLGHAVYPPRGRRGVQARGDAAWLGGAKGF